MKVEPIEYFYSAYSAYAYIGHYQFLRLAEKAGREVVHRPFDLMTCLNAIGYHPLGERTQASWIISLDVKETGGRSTGKLKCQKRRQVPIAMALK
jgi:2-hydroxychromene-2-carboxylate isomerase